MTFQVYYRKWRPQRFRELAGQQHVSATLQQAVQLGRVAHSLLFCGPRGTGKTSTARVLAKAVNCLEPEDGDPCNECARCQAVNEGRFMDLIELDAASNRGIDEIRNIRDRVNLAAAEGSYKVYIIDEAHMLTEHASNAFLKTLEEPPAHAIFILCTTDPQKILPTIISRCQRFDFRRLTSDAIMERLRMIQAEEGVDVSTEALQSLAHSAGGSLRDAENLLEQLVVSYGSSIGVNEVHELLGLGQGERALDLIRYLLLGNTSAALSAINRAAWDGADLRQLHREAVNLLRGVLLLQYGSRDSLDFPQETIRELEDVAPKASAARVIKSLKLLGEVNMRHDTSSPLHLELAVVEACMDEAPAEAPAKAEAAQPNPPRPSPAVQPAARTTPNQAPNTPATGERRAGDAGTRAISRPSPTAPGSQPARVRESGNSPPPSSEHTLPREANGPVPSSTPGNPGPGDSFQEQWGTLVKTLSRYKGKRFNIGALLRDCKNQDVEGETLVLTFAHRSHLERMQEELDDPQGMKTVNEALLKSLGASYRLRLSLAEGNGGGNPPATAQSPLVRAALSMGARIMEEREQ
ncbi:MAG: DNA polymerase III subunit gamma/tau [Dehalococcoidia bacterium]|nr:DNA polymerase III subunit gamma/tau [Dehalococcoidia bacterium]